MKIVKKLIKNELKKRGLTTINEENLDALKSLNSFSNLFFRQVTGSQSQLFQDLFVLLETKAKRGGFFVEFGATNGIDLSNTYLLEKEYGWSGILAEPARCWHQQLKNNRSSKLDVRCVWKESGQKLEFIETNSPELSTIHTFSSSDGHALSRENGSQYFVETVSLIDLLKQHDAPSSIDYLSIDTEGSELEILTAFDFSKYDIKMITCEHNYTSNREKIHSLLSANGYTRKYAEISYFDDWYVKEE